MDHTTRIDTANEAPEPPRPALSPAAARALAEAEARRAEALAREAALPKETGGRGGNDPARYGDWEVKGIACDF
ncbi:MAG: DUF1674 domain-containing protein [Aquamicrobium sp.]|uniref:DUF1674 domain-containing protein n=1 Tax=Aquamicrobium sp. TaxID=1872579 RepID=UPI00349EF362|nr:DUF1674 domain-containing protein [Aquamicrobium sp.]MCO5155256.1 DUF1674 domain-containing protein [Aquamicrobium sp.]